MKRALTFILISIFILILQQSFLSGLKINFLALDATLAFIACSSLLLDEVESFIVALVTGLIVDSFSPYVFGVNSIIYISISYLFALVQKKIYKERTLILILLNVLAVILKYLIIFGSYYIASIKIDFIKIIKDVVPFELISNTIFAILLFSFLKKIVNIAFLQKEWKF
ncbi:rod shape-determining protein MreD [Caloramator sp. CAR-1]|uniref:rod shape-determining protein MreD n=1 Tax=Caloramator sp. CAR-1 TaxID=3062777 RepID=UPI0026E2224B|nr:rod shape-determining protein MreD [Caloramator sp. CAR-1]MDO6355339.1 rod shape-determining protein MreD [Caloramator sp. CAR-1]